MAGTFHISEMASLAIHSMALLAVKDNELLNVKQIARAVGASENHLAKVLQRLTKAGLVHSVRGPKGGFALVKPSEKITLLAIYEAVEGKLTIDGCPLDRIICPFKQCLFGGKIQKLNQEFREYLLNKTLWDIIKEESME